MRRKRKWRWLTWNGLGHNLEMWSHAERPVFNMHEMRWSQRNPRAAFHSLCSDGMRDLVRIDDDLAYGSPFAARVSFDIRRRKFANAEPGWVRSGGVSYLELFPDVPKPPPNCYDDEHEYIDLSRNVWEAMTDCPHPKSELSPSGYGYREKVWRVWHRVTVVDDELFWVNLEDDPSSVALLHRDKPNLAI